jgi:uncharacterized protein (DUF608 family)
MKCTGSNCGCSRPSAPAGWARRDFLKVIGLSTGALTLSQFQVMAGPFERADFNKLVPADKKLRPEWVKSLTERGEREVYRGKDLEKIGMPIGGICAGQLYLGGDGKLWHWDIFNQQIGTGSEHYAQPMKPACPLEQGFAVRLTDAGQTQERPLDAAHWRDVSFIGEYPIGYVEYRDADCPLSVSLEAFSPFIPLNPDDSALPATVLEFTLKNTGSAAIEAELAGWLENPVCLHTAKTREGLRRNRLVRNADQLSLECSAEEPPASPPSNRPDIVFESFESETYDKWTVTGTAFGSGPIELSKVPQYQGDLGGNGKRVANSHASAPGNTTEEKDAATGTLTSRPFTIDRHYITLLVGGGSHAGKTCVNLLIDDKVVLSAAGQDNNKMRPVSWDVRQWAGKSATLQVVDNVSGPWGNIGVDDIVFTDQPSGPPGRLAEAADFGTLCLSLLDPKRTDFGATALSGEGAACGVFSTPGPSTDPVKRAFGQKLIGSVTRKVKLAPGASTKATFLLAWHIPNLKMQGLPPGRHYATRFDSAAAVTEYVRKDFARLSRETRLWHDTWYDSTMPYWFLDRTFLNTSILATSTCHRFASGRFYGWEGVGCCAGTCGHVWQYAHAVARLFPNLESTTRETVDFGLAQQPDGSIHFRGEMDRIPAIDAQAGTILRALREHQMSTNDAFLKRNWPHIKKAVEWLIAKDANADGLIESNQHNTLDTDWFGPVAWLSGLYLAALLAAETMAIELGDQEFADKCRAILQAGQRNIVAQLFDEKYFINKPDPKHPEAINSGSGCEIDQVMGQSWAFQVGLPRVLPERETLAALKSLWRYNFTPDVGPYREVYKPGRWYAMAGEAGLLMCSFPRSDWDYGQAKGKGADWAAGYFNECMNGFEYQAAGHMIWEGLLTEGLAVTRAVHDRYHPSRRNPWNEIECGDHYARSMASYGVYLAACGFACHGPQRRMGFAPRLLASQGTKGADSFKCAFTSPEGWGSYAQVFDARTAHFKIAVKWGKLRLRTLDLPLPEGLSAGTLQVRANGNSLKTRHAQTGTHLTITFLDEAEVAAGRELSVTVA